MIPLSLNILYLPVIIFCIFIIALGTSMVLSALNVVYHDIQYICALVCVGFLHTGDLSSECIFPSTAGYFEYKSLHRVIYLAVMSRCIPKCEPGIIFICHLHRMIILGIGYAIFMRLEHGSRRNCDEYH